VWLSAAGLPLVVLIVGAGQQMIFRTWPQFSVFGAIVTIGYIVVRGVAGSRALRTRRKILQLAAAWPEQSVTVTHGQSPAKLRPR